MNAALGGEVDEFGGLAYASQRSLNHSGRSTGNGNHRAVVVGVARPVKQANTIDPHSSDDGADFSLIQPFREIRHAFDDWPIHPSLLRRLGARFAHSGPISTSYNQARTGRWR